MTNEATTADLMDELTRLRASLAAAEQRAALAGALLREINEKMIYRGRGSTHWEGCEQQHDECAMRKQIETFLAAIAKEQPKP